MNKIIQKSNIIILLLAVCLIMASCGSATISEEPEPPETPTEAPTPTPALTDEDIDAALSGLIYVEDEFTKNKTYRSKADAKINSNGKLESTVTIDKVDPLFLYLYRDDTVTPCVSFVYYGESWIFFDKVEILIDDELYTFDLSSFTSNREVTDLANVYEQYFLTMSDDMIEAFSSIETTSDVSVRYSGEKSYTFDVTAKMKVAIQDVMKAYNSVA